MRTPSVFFHTLLATAGCVFQRCPRVRGRWSRAMWHGNATRASAASTAAANRWVEGRVRLAVRCRPVPFSAMDSGHSQAVSRTSLLNQSRADFEASVASAAGIELANGGGGPKQLHGCGRRRCRKRSNGNHQGHGTARRHMHNLSSLALQDGFSEARLRACIEAGLLGRINFTTLTTTVACASRQHARYCGWRTAARPHA